MKRLILFTVLVIFVCNITVGQWYLKDFGVRSLNELTKTELEGALLHYQSRLTLHLTLTGIGVASLIGGIVLYNNSVELAEGSLDDPETWAAGFGMLFGFSFILLGAVLAPVGLVGIIVQSDKISDLKEALGSPDLKLGVLNYPVNGSPGSYNLSPAFGATLTFHF